MTIELDKLEDSPHLLDLLIQMEDILDTFDIYVFKNWFDGELIDGPKVRRYWLDMTLRFPYEKMPDPRGGLRLLKHGVRVDYTKINTTQDDKIDEAQDVKSDEESAGEWHVRISIPRRLVVDANAGELDFYDEEVDIDDVQDANDKGMNDETGYMDDENEEGAAPDAGLGNDSLDGDLGQDNEEAPQK